MQSLETMVLVSKF